MELHNNPNKLTTFSTYDEIRTPTNFFSDLFISQSQKKNKINDASGQFFNKKKKRIFLIWAIIFIFIIFLVFRFFLNLNLIDFFKKLSSISGNNHFLFVMIAGSIFFCINDVFLRIKILKTKISSKLNDVKIWEWVSYAFISFFIQSITPFSIGSEPYTIWWLKRKRVDMKTSTAVVAVSSFCWFISQFLITWPSFIYITIAHWSSISSFTITKTYWGIVFGLLVDIFIGCAIFGISYAKKIHYRIALIINFIKRHLGIGYLEKSDIEVKYLKNDVFKKIYLKHLKSKSTLKIIFLFIIQNLYYYFLFAFIYKIFNNNIDLGSFFNAYNIINVSTTSNNFLPLPSSEGSLQLVIQSLAENLMTMNNKSTVNGNNNSDVANIIFLWRFFTKYCGLFFSFLYLTIFGFNFHKKKTKPHYQLSQIDSVLTF